MKFSLYDLQRQQQLAQQRLQQQFQDYQQQPEQRQQEGSEGDSGASGGSGEDPGDGGADNEKLMNALRSEREGNKNRDKEIKTLKAQLDAYAGLSPELAEKAKTILAQQEHSAKQESLIRSEVEQSYQPKIQELEKGKSEAETRYYNLVLDTELERECAKLGCFPGEYGAVAPALRGRVKFDTESNQFKVYDTNGKPAYLKGEPMTVPQLIADLKKNELWFARHFKGVDGAGAGFYANGKNGYINDATFRDLPAWKRVELQRQAQAE